MTKILFILKRKQDYNIDRDSADISLSTGLYNSASYVADMIRPFVDEVNLVVVTDNNDIDREVTKYKPTHVIIEALWVVPEKFEILSKLHPKVTWVIRVHSEMPFMAGEGMAMRWIGQYSNYDNIVLAINAPRMYDEVKFYIRTKHKMTAKQVEKKVIYLPNYYPTDFKNTPKIKKSHLDIACFGAVRPLKNHLVQAIAALKFAESNGKKLKFHINSTRLEMQGQPVLHNLIGLFDQVKERGHELIHHPWLPKNEFIDLCKTIDVGMQVSFSETFNIVSADFVSQGIPVITSTEIPWTYMGTADPTDSNEIANSLSWAYNMPRINVFVNQIGLKQYSYKSRKIWVDYFCTKCYKIRDDFNKNNSRDLKSR